MTMREWGDLWLNETFATVEATIAQAALRDEHAWVNFATAVKSRALAHDQLSTTHPILLDCVDTNGIRPNFDGITYQKGAPALRQLVSWVGDDAFVEGIRSYLGSFAWGNATRADFLQQQADASGRDLHEWSRLWLELPGVNTLTPEFTVDGKQYAAFAVLQHPDAVQGAVRPHRVQVALYRQRQGQLVRDRAVEVDITGARTEIPELAGEPVADLAVVNDADLTFAKLRFGQVWRDREYEEARTVTEGLFPHHRADADTIAAVERLLSSGELPRIGHRLVTEGLDGLVGTRRARGADQAGAPLRARVC